MEAVWTLVGQFVAALGGAVVLLFAFSSFFGKLFADRFIEIKKAELNAQNERLKDELNREMETHRVRLRKSEKFFEIEFEAVSKFVALRRNMMPRHRVPEMDWADACDEIAMQFGELEGLFSDFISEYGAVLSDEAVDLISNCISLAGQNKFEASSEEISPGANAAANDLYDNASEAEKVLLNNLRSQIAK
jgi:hypothetical protein